MMQLRNKGVIKKGTFENPKEETVTVSPMAVTPIDHTNKALTAKFQAAYEMLDLIKDYLDKARNTTTYEQYAEQMRFALTYTEKTSAIVRSLYVIGPYKKMNYLLSLHALKHSCEHGCTFDYTEEGYWHIVIPKIVPSRKMSQKTRHYMAQTIELLLESQETLISPIDKKNNEKAMYVFVHHYDRNIQYGGFRDYDNLETKSIIDVITSHCMRDDNMSVLNLMHCSMEDDTDYTEIYVLPSSEIGTFINAYGTGKF